MRKFDIFKPMVLSLIASPLLSFAQPNMAAWEFDGDTTNKNYYINYIGGRVIINSPAQLAGQLSHTISNDGTNLTGAWGRSIKGLAMPIADVDVVKAEPYQACGTLTNAAALNGKIAIVERGNCEFGAKAVQAQQAGAIAVIIVNNIPGPAVGMGAGAQGGNANIPVIMVSDVDGAAIVAALGTGVKMTLSTWSNGFNNDIGFVDRGLATAHAFSIPLDQIKGSTASGYKGFTGAVLANFGTTTATSVKVRATLTWTPTGGSATVVRMDSVTINNFTAMDSIRTPFVDALYDLNPQTTGRYDVDYEAIPNFTDQYLGDNKAHYTFYIHNSLYSKGRYDFANNKPFSGASYRLGDGTTEFTWGNLFYVEKGGFQIEKVQVALSKDGAATNNSMAGINPVQLLVYKWKDGGTGDTIITGPEMTPVGYASKSFVAADTSGQVHDVNILDIGGKLPCTTEANTWYWVAAAVPTGTFINVDGVTNSFVRAWGRTKVTARQREPYAPLFNANFSGLSSATSPLLHYPFERYFFMEDSIRFSQQRKGFLPCLPIHMSLFKVGVEEVQTLHDIKVYPNPATDVINVSINLEKEAKEVYYSLMSINGTKVSDEKHTNVKKDKYSISTSQLPAGSYILIVNIDGVAQMKQFSIVK